MATVAVSKLASSLFGTQSEFVQRKQQNKKEKA